ncbi:MAG TPA: acetyl-CoA carboxylase carboxyltransferase subunit alpha, partial [Alphaproteobacteria bacterium]
MATYLEFEKPIAELEGKIRELRHLSDDGQINIVTEVTRLQAKVERLLRQTYKELGPEQIMMVARHPERPHCLDYIGALMTDFTPLAGDRLFGEDEALVGGLAKFRGQPCVVMGQEKGFDTETRIKHNFGMAKPEGYRKAQRLVHLATQFNLPIITFVDTAGAYPGVDAEARGQSEAIAKSVDVFLAAPVPIISTVIGEGGSGGAIAIAAADRVFMLEYSIYSVISPEGCASILWRSAEYAKQAAAALRLTANDLLELGVIDSIIEEPMGGAHRLKEEAYHRVGMAIENALAELKPLPGQTIKQKRA